MLEKNFGVEKRMLEPEPEPEIRFEDFPQTHDGAVEFVQALFQSWGGEVGPPTRPGRCLALLPDSFMMDFENACLEHNWDSSKRSHPIGPTRHLDKEWADMIKTNVYPNHSDVDWYEYVWWVERGGGDEWFQLEINE